MFFSSFVLEVVLFINPKLYFFYNFYNFELKFLIFASKEKNIKVTNTGFLHFNI